MKPARVSAAIVVAAIAMATTTAIDAAVTPPTQINAPLPGGGDVHPDLAVTPDSRRVVYRADRAADARDELYSWATDGGSAPVKLNGPLDSGGDVRSFRLAPGSDVVAYIADQETGGRDELHAVPVDGSGPPVVLSRDVVPASGDVLDFTISPDGTSVVFRADKGAGTARELYARPIDASTPSVKLSGPMSPGGDVRPAYLVSDDSGRVVYTADETLDGEFELYSAPIGGGGAERLNGDLTPGGDVQTDFAVSADTVVYRADAEVDGLVELYAVPIDGHTDPSKISGPLVAGGLGTKVAITPDSTRAIYLARTAPDLRRELFSSRLDGTATQVRLNGDLTTDGDVGSFAIAPHSGLVVYRADQQIDGSWALYTRPPDGSGTATLVSAAPVPGREVWSTFAISPDEQWLVYLEGPTNGPPHHLDLYAGPLAGGGTIARLNTGADGAGVVESRVSITPDSERVVYQADDVIAGTVELFSRPIDAGGAPTRMNGPLAEGAAVVDHVVLPDSSAVVYRADQDVVGEHEAFLAEWAFPEAADDVAVVDADASVPVDVLANDTVAAGSLDVASLVVTIAPAQGSATVGDGGTVVYAPGTGFTDGYDSFAYRVCVVDDSTLCDTAIVTIGVGDVPPPTTTTTTTTTTTAPPTTTTTAPKPTTTAPKPTTTAPKSITPKPTTTVSPTTAPEPTTTTTSPSTSRPAQASESGYWLVEADGDIHAFGAAPELASIRADLDAGQSAVALAAHPDGDGVWVLTSDGDVVARGTAVDFGRVDLGELTKPGEVVSTLSANPDGDGLWVFTSAGRIIAFGSALPADRMAGSAAVLALTLDGPVVDSVATPSGRGAYMVSSDGGLFAVGDAAFVGSVRGTLSALNGPPGLPDAPVVGIVPDPDGVGYWNVAADGGVFAFAAPFRGSLPGLIAYDQLAAPVNGMVAYGNGYLLVAADGGVFTFSSSPFAGSSSGRIDSTVVGIAATG